MLCLTLLQFYFFFAHKSETFKPRNEKVTLLKMGYVRVEPEKFPVVRNAQTTRLPFAFLFESLRGVDYIR